MSVPNIQLYEALKKDISEDAARMIAEVVPPAGELATKTDIHALKTDIHRLGARIDAVSHELGARIDAVSHELGSRMDQLEARTLRWTLGMFVPLWVAVLATLIALVVQA